MSSMTAGPLTLGVNVERQAYVSYAWQTPEASWHQI